MNIHKPGICALATALALTTTAFAAREAPDSREPDTKEPTQQSPIAAVDAALRANIKEYIGLRVEAEKAVFLTMTKGGDVEAAANLAREAWIQVVGKEQREHLPHFEFTEVAASPEELRSAFVQMRDVLTLENVVYLDLDESCGCIAVGIANDSAAMSVMNFAKKHGVWHGWLKMPITPQFKRTIDLTNEYRPTMGGIQIQTRAGTCTLGLPTYSFTRGTQGFLTASHCTEGTQGAMMGSGITQAGGKLFWLDKIGDETLDLAMFDSNTNASCPAGRLCRMSDAVFADYNRSDAGITGRVMRPTSVCTAAGTSCSLDVTRATDDIRMVFGISGLFVGTNVDKVGRTSGWTRGTISNTCTSINIIDQDPTGAIVDTGMTLLCQDRVATTSLPGDSGSPVFEFSASTGTGAFAGILWGGSTDGTAMVYSPISGIQQDLGFFVFNQAGTAAPFFSSGRFYTSDPYDVLDVVVEPNVMPADVLEVVLIGGTSVRHRKEIVLVEGAAAGIGRWTIGVTNTGQSDRNGLYTYQFPGGRLEFRKQIGNSVSEVSRIPIDAIPGGTRLTFTWQTN